MVVVLTPTAFFVRCWIPDIHPMIGISSYLKPVLLPIDWSLCQEIGKLGSNRKFSITRGIVLFLHRGKGEAWRRDYLHS